MNQGRELEGLGALASTPATVASEHCKGMAKISLKLVKPMIDPARFDVRYQRAPGRDIN